MENPDIPGRIQMERLIPVEILQKKEIPLEVLPFSRFYRNDRNFVPFIWITSARLHVQRKRKLYRYFVNGTTQSRACFWCQKIPVPFDGNFPPKFGRRSVKRRTSLFNSFCSNVHVFCCLFYRTFKVMLHGTIRNDDF